MNGSGTGWISCFTVAAMVLGNLEYPITLLCAVRSYSPEYVGQLELLGGKVEPAERSEQVLVRELDGEIGLGVRPGLELVIPRRLAVVAPLSSGPGDDAPVWPVIYGFRMRVWLAEPVHPGERGRAGDDHQRLEWVCLDPPDQLCQPPWLEMDLPIIDVLIDALGR